MTDMKRNNVLYSLLSLKYRDDEMLEMACESMIRAKNPNAASITNLLYLLAKFNFEPKEEFMKKCTDLLKAEPALTVGFASRNLWNLYALNYYDKKLFDKFGSIIVKDFKDMREVDVANALCAFAHFKHMDTEIAAETLESLIKISIRNIMNYKTQSIAVITNALADLEVKNTTIFSIVKSELLRPLVPDDLSDPSVPKP